MLLETMLGEREHFVPTEVIIKGKGVVDSKTHVAASRRAGRSCGRIRPWFVEEMLRVARGVFDRLQVDAMREIYIELSATAHRGGGFFRAHRDNAGMYPTRRVQLRLLLPPRPQAVQRRRTAAVRHVRHDQRLPHDGVLAHRPGTQQHRVLSERLLPRGAAGAVRIRRARGRALHRPRLGSIAATSGSPSSRADCRPRPPPKPATATLDVGELLAVPRCA